MVGMPDAEPLLLEQTPARTLGVDVVKTRSISSWLPMKLRPEADFRRRKGTIGSA